MCFIGYVRTAILVMFYIGYCLCVLSQLKKHRVRQGLMVLHSHNPEHPVTIDYCLVWKHIQAHNKENGQNYHQSVKDHRLQTPHTMHHLTSNQDHG